MFKLNLNLSNLFLLLFINSITPINSYESSSYESPYEDQWTGLTGNMYLDMAIDNYTDYVKNYKSFNYFLKKYERDYDRDYNESEYWIRYNIFNTNLNYIHDSNNNRNKTYKLGINNFTDMTFKEFKGIYLKLKINPYSKNYTMSNYISKKDPIPSNIDWRADGLVTNVKDQGQCGSCWAFSAIGAIEGQHAKKYGELVSLSEQNLVDCALNYSCDGCEGGWPDNAMEYVIDNKGVDTEQSYAYQGVDEACEYNKTTTGAVIHNVTRLPVGNMSALYNAIANIGPISVALDAEYDFQMYSSGIFTSKTCSTTELDHAVLAVGYGVFNGSKYIIIKNSWSPSWGMDGYIYFSADIDNMCGIAQHSSYPEN